VIRAVLDTNLLVSYLLTHRPPIATLIDEHMAQEHLVLVTGAALLKELDRVLRYPRLQRTYSEETRTQYVALIAALSEIVELPESVPRIGRDPDDDWVIDCTWLGSRCHRQRCPRSAGTEASGRTPCSLCSTVPGNP
jgi:putative PIN family toxin of toxin-antitoxin system